MLLIQIVLTAIKADVHVNELIINKLLMNYWLPSEISKRKFHQMKIHLKFTSQFDIGQALFGSLTMDLQL